MKKAVLITGHQGLIGKELCKEFLNQGYKVYGIDKEKSERLSEDHICLKCDLTKESQIRSVLKKIDRLDVLINNAARANPHNKKIHLLSLKEWNETLATNLSSVFLMVKYAVPLLMKTKGSIINVSSTRHLMAEPNTEVYCTSKGGIISLTKSLAISLGPDIRVNAISPGWIHDPGEKLRPVDHQQHPVGRVGTPEDIAKLAYFLANDGSSFMTGSDIVIDGGMTSKMIYV